MTQMSKEFGFAGCTLEIISYIFNNIRDAMNFPFMVMGYTSCLVLIYNFSFEKHFGAFMAHKIFIESAGSYVYIFI